MNEIKKIISEGHLDDALNLLLNANMSNQMSIDIASLSGRYKDLQKQLQLGKISFEEASAEKNKIRYSILCFVDELQDPAFDANANKVGLLLRRLSLLNGILLRLIHTSIQINAKAKILNYGSEPLRYMPKTDIEACKALEDNLLKPTYNILFHDSQLRYYQECMDVLGTMSLENETLFEYHHHMSSMMGFYSRALSSAIPWYYIAVYCVNPKEDNNLLLVSKKMLQSLRIAYETHNKNNGDEWHCIPIGHELYTFATSIKVIEEVEEMIKNLASPPNNVLDNNIT